MEDDDIKELEEKLKELKLNKRIKQLQQEGYSDVPLTLKYGRQKE